MTKKDRSRSERMFRALLRLFPFDFRWKHGREMEQMFRQRRKEEERQGGTMGKLKLWWATLVDIARTAPREHLEMLAQDAGYALRLMRKNLGFTTVAVLTLALGIGANTAIFSVANNIFLRPLPFHEAGRLVRLLDYTLAPSGERRTVNMSNLNFATIREQNRVFEGVVSQRGHNFSLTGGEAPERVSVVTVSKGWLEVHGIRLGLGRSFTEEEGQQGTDSGVALISHSLWQRRFGGSPAVLGKRVTLDNRSFTVIGVLTPGFRYPYDADLWVPATPDLAQRRGHDLNVVALLKPRVTLEQAQADLERIARQLAADFPDTNYGFGLMAVPLRERFMEGDDRIPLVLLGVVGFFLLIACLNVANLLLARFVSRQKEVAIRAALGASRTRQVRQFFTESLLLSLLGGGSGLLLVFWSAPYLDVLVPRVLRGQLALGDVGIDVSVLGFNLTLSVLTSLFFGAAPAFQAAGQDPQSLLKEGGRSHTDGGSRRLLAALVVGEIALALVLLAGAGIMIKNLQQLQRFDAGFETRNLLTTQFSLDEARYADAGTRATLVEEVLTVVRNTPGVVEAGLTSVNPLCCGDWGARVVVEGKQPGPGEDPIVIHHRYITSGLLEAMGVPLLQGRYFTEQDRVGAQNVVIIDEQMTHNFWPGEDPIGKRIRGTAPGSPWRTVIGVVGYVENAGDYTETWYLPFFQDPMGSSNDIVHLMVRIAIDPSGLVRPIQSAIWEVDRNLAFSQTTTMDRLYSDTLSQDRMGTVVLGLFAAFGLVLAALGIYGVMSYAVGRQTHEFGIRMALGAQVGDIRRLVLRRGMLLAVAGVTLGLIGTRVLAGLLTDVLTEVDPVDPIILIAASVLLAGVALLACYLPARRATKVDPMVALRCE